MQATIIKIIAFKFLKDSFQSRGVYLLLGIFALLSFYAAWSGWESFEHHNETGTAHQEWARESWEANPDKHPHRMAHFGTFAFRLKHPLSVFDFGLESYMGNAVFLEAHAQNSVHFSQASQSSSLLRFGELSMAMLLQTVFPLMLFFLGYRSVVQEREQGTLKLAMVQGARLPSLVLGKTLGLFVLGLIFLLPILLGWSLLGWLHSYEHWILGWSFGLLAGGYLLYTLLLCLVCVWVSYRSRTSRTALLRLVGIWILAVILIPKSVQSLGRSLYPAPNTFAFYSELSREINAVGNSHNPNDPYFSALRDSVLQVHQVDKITELPFNYGGFIMREGEKLSARIYDRHHQQLLDIYREQNSLTRRFSWINPYLSLRLFSRILARSDFETYTAFKNQAEAYRYQMAQRMNQLQMDLISSQRPSGSEGRIHVVSRDHWKALPDFKYQFASEKEVLQKASGFVWVLFFWNVFALFGLLLSTNKPIDLLS